MTKQGVIPSILIEKKQRCVTSSKFNESTKKYNFLSTSNEKTVNSLKPPCF